MVNGFVVTLILLLGSCLASTVEFLGRFSQDGSVYSADWSGSTFRFGVTKPFNHIYVDEAVTISFVNCVSADDYFVEVYVNAAKYSKFHIGINSSQITIPISKSDVFSNIEVIKITEPGSGVMSLNVDTSIVVTSGLALTSFKSDNKINRLLVIGDSITCAYGVEGNTHCIYVCV